MEELRCDLNNIISENVRGNMSCISEDNIGSEKYHVLSKWFSQHTLTFLLRLWSIVEKRIGDNNRLFFQVCLSHILKASCSQRKHWGWIADNVAPKTMIDKDIVSLFVRHCTEMIGAFEKYYDQIEATKQNSMDVLSKSMVYLHDSRFAININRKVDAVITSPPYPSVIDYTKAHRLSYILFGWDLEGDKKIEIGARWKRTRKNQMAEYKEDIVRAFENIDPLLRNGGLIGMVIDATKRRRSVLSEHIYLDIAKMLEKRFGYEGIGKSIIRQYSDQRLTDSKGSQNTESIVVLRKP
jgi:hypothetical protein